MTGMLEVDTGAMDQLADRIRQAAAEAWAAGTDPEPLRASIRGLAAPGLVQAADVFVDSWSATLAGIVSDAHRVADAIALVSRSYRDAEAVNTRRMLP